MEQIQTIEIPIAGMDCAECTQHVRQAISKLGGVQKVDVFLTSEKAIIQLDPTLVQISQIRAAVKGAGYSVPEKQDRTTNLDTAEYSRRLFTALGISFGAVVLLVVAGEWLGLLEDITERVPFTVGVLLVLVGGSTIFLNVIRSLLNRQIIAHTLMTVGVLAALFVGEWTTALVVVFFMHIGSYTERLTAEGARRAVKDLTALAPQTARLERDGVESLVPIAEVKLNDIVLVRPGEKLPVDGDVISGQGTIDQSSVTGESMPIDAGVGVHVFAATILK